MKLTIAHATDLGRRKNNEDAVFTDERLGLAVVADGMGGYEGGEVASRITVESVRELVARTARDADCTWPYAADLSRTSDENELLIAARLANDRVTAQRSGLLQSMGATLAVAKVRGHRATIAHVGDSRVYHVRGGQARSLTRDHSLYEELVRTGEPVPPRAQFPYGNVITRAIGAAQSAAEACWVDLAPGDFLVVCTDGLWDPVPEAELAAIATTLPPVLACERLVAEALARGGTDNITVAIIAVS